MADAEVLAHVERYLGPRTRVVSARVGSGGSTSDGSMSGGVGSGRSTSGGVGSGGSTSSWVGSGGVAVHASPSMVTAVTDGLPSLGTPLPLEFACSAHPEFEAEAVRLVTLFADLSVRSRTEVEYDDGYLAEEPLIVGTALYGLLAAPHPYADEMFNLFRDAAGELRLQFVTLVPVTEAEGRYLRDHETGDLFELWESVGADLLDLRRPSAI